MKKEINYRALFFSGLAFISSGVALMITLGPVGFALIAVGIVMIAGGLSHREEWEQKN
jgi:uncharacterized membrane protein HdeD (DUF308 family)